MKFKLSFILFAAVMLSALCFTPACQSDKPPAQTEQTEFAPDSIGQVQYDFQVPTLPGSPETSPAGGGGASKGSVIIEDQILYAKPSVPVVRAGFSFGGIADWLSKNWYWILAALALWEAIARITPTEADNTILNLLRQFLDKLLPNFKLGGGKF